MKNLIAICGLMLISFAASAVDITIKENHVNDKEEIVEKIDQSKNNDFRFTGYVSQTGGGHADGQWGYSIKLNGSYLVKSDGDYRRDLTLTISGKEDELMYEHDLLDFQGQNVEIYRSARILRIEGKKSKLIILKE